jgi:hypothetical protein
MTHVLYESTGQKPITDNQYLITPLNRSFSFQHQILIDGING